MISPEALAGMLAMVSLCDGLDRDARDGLTDFDSPFR